MIVLTLAVALLLLILVLVINKKKEVAYVRSSLDGNIYLVRDLSDKEEAANMLAKLKKNVFKLSKHLENNKRNHEKMLPYINQLSQRIKGVKISESTKDSMYTSYTVDKGEEIIFCLRSKKNKDELHDINLVMYVCIHELAHVACPEYGHTLLFKKIFAFFCEESLKIGIYEKMKFYENPEEYCGLNITDSII